MLTCNKTVSSSVSISQWLRRIPWLLIPVMVLSLTIAHAQQLTATLSGIAADQSGARIAGASVLVVNDATGDRRDTKADSEGFFSVTALIPGTYSVTVSAKNFASWKETGVLLNQGDSRTIANIHLKVSSDVTAITVVSGADAEVPTDNAEVSATLNNELVDTATLTGRNAAELMKMMPGVAFNNGSNAGSGYNSQTTGTNNGPAGAFSANGTQPAGSTAVILDGANLLDPGAAGSQVANINQDMTDSVKFSSAATGAEYAKGPAVLQAFSKSGTQKFHGEAYLYARNSGAGYANDWFNKVEQEGTAASLPGATPASIKAANKILDQHFYYIGGNIGGPIFFKGFNKNRDKLFFWGGYEKMYQTPYTSPDVMNVPTVDQMNGDFNNTGVDSHVISQYGDAYNKPCATNDYWQGCSTTTSPWGSYDAYDSSVTGAVEPNNTVPNLKAYFDPNGVILSEQTVPGSTNSKPMATQKYITPTAQNGWNNFSYSPSLPQNRWEVTGKVTYAFNDNNKIWGSYAYQSETDEHPISAWWAPEWTVPYPSQPTGKETANLYLANFTHVFSSTTTNEFVIAYSKFDNKFSGGNMKAVSRSALGFPTSSLFQTTNLSDVLPVSAGGWGDGTPFIGYEQGDFTSGIYGANSFGKTAKSPSITDNFTKIVKTHSLKGGFYWDGEENIQASYSQGSGPNGAFNMSRWNATSTYNTILDRLMGRIGDYSEQSNAKSFAPDVKQHQWSIWGQDSWKATPKLTINVGLRADHEGQWWDKIGGTQVFDLASYNNTTSAPANTGLLWHQIDSKIPTSGFKSKLFFYNPRLGVAWDVFGTGKTVIRGGAGSYRYQISVNDATGAMSGPLGSYTVDFNTSTGDSGFYGYNVQGGTVCNSISYATTTTTGPGTCTATGSKTYTLPTGLNQNGTSPGVDKENDSKVPYAWTWSFGVAQALPSHTVAEFTYVGSASRNQFENGGNGHIQDANPVAYGAFFEPDPQNFLYENPAPLTPKNDPNVNDGYFAVNTSQYQPLINYGHIYLLTHGGYANYHSLQVSAQKQSGNLFLFTNFTFGKVLGTRDGSTSNNNGNGAVVDPFSLDANYAPLAYDHTKIFNVSFSYKLPKPIHNNWALGEAINGWQISGYTTYQDGSPYQAGSTNMNMNYEQLTVNGTTTDTTIYLPIPTTSMARQTVNGVTSDVVAGNTTTSIGQSEWIGSNQGGGIQPLITCDPRKGRKSGEYFNTKCFAAPLPPTATSFGQEGPVIWPYIRNPHYWGSDLAIFKAFKVTEAQRAEIRISATNWLNHPNSQFGLAGTSDNQLLFNGLSSASSLTRNSNASTTGKPLNKVGYRWMQFAAKYYF